MADFKGWMTLVVMSVAWMAQATEARLINGKEVQPGTYKEVIQIKSNGASCTATVVGPRVIATAAHCAANGATATFSIGGDSYTATMYRSTLYPKQDHDIALGVTTKDITGISPASIGGTASKGLRITLLGFGCTQVQGGPSDGKLRSGETVVTDMFDFFMKSFESNGAALCFGDSGGPAFVVSNGTRLLLGVNSKGNIQDTNYHTRADLADSVTFFKSVASSAGVDICGVTKDCSGQTPNAPTCTLSAVPGTIMQGQSLALNLVTQGSVTSATIDGTPVVLTGGTGSKSVTGTTVGTFNANAQVTGPGGTGTCATTYQVDPSTQPNAPTCSISLNPPMITLGQSSTATLAITSGTATTVTLDGQSLAATGGSITVKPSAVGMKMVNGFVSGPGGSNSCSASLQVNSDNPNPISNYDVVPTYCGPNTLGGPVKEVCLAVIAYSYAKRDLGFKEAIVIENSDGTKEFEPIINRQLGRKRANSAEVYEELTYYANTMLENNGKYQLKIQRGLLKTNPQGAAQSIQGHSPSDNFFLVQKLTPVAPN